MALWFYFVCYCMFKSEWRLEHCVNQLFAATPSSTPKRGRALPIPPAGDGGSLRGARGRRLPMPPPAPPPLTSSYSTMTSTFASLTSQAHLTTQAPAALTRHHRVPSTTTLIATHVPYVSGEQSMLSVILLY